MKIERTKSSVKNTFFGMINRLISLLIPFIIRTIIVQKIGSEFLGLSSLFTSIIQILNLTELGIGSALVFEMYKPVAEDDISTLAGLLQAYKKIYRIIGLIVCAIGVIIMPLLPVLVDVKQLEGTGVNLYLLFLIYLFNTVGSYLFFAYRKSLFMAYQRYDIISNIGTLVNILLYAIQIGVLFAFANYYLYILIMPVCTILENILVAILTKKRYANILSAPADARNFTKGIFEKTKYVIGHKIGAVVVQSADSIVISTFLDLIVLAKYSNYFLVVSALTGIINVGYTAILSSVGNSVVTQTKEKNYRLFNELSYLIFIIVGVCSACLTTLYQPLIELWMGSDFLFPMSTVVLFVIYFYTWQIRVISLNFKDAAGMWKSDWLKPYVGAGLNLIINIILIQFWGVDGVLIATVIQMTLVYFPWETYVLHKELFQCRAKGYLMKELFYLILSILACAVTYMLTDKIEASGFWELCIKAPITVIVALLTLVLPTCRTSEFNELCARGKALCKRLKH